MEAWLQWARGPMFKFAFVFMMFGLLRCLGLTAYGVIKSLRSTDDKNINLRMIIKFTLKWLFPLDKVKVKPIYSVISIIFHLSIIITPIFLLAHIVLWKRGLGVGWPALNQQIADILTLTAIASAWLLFLGRIFNKDSRHLSRFQDYMLPPLISIPFITGYLAMHPWLNPFDYTAVMLVHVLSGNLIFILMPLSKLSHAVLLPTTQLVSEVTWRFPRHYAGKVSLILNKENKV